MNWQPNTEGIFFDLAEDIYRGAPGVNVSNLKKMSTSPAHYRAGIEQKKESTAAQVFGKMSHLAALEPHRLQSEFVLKPEGMSFVSKEGKLWRDSQTQTILDRDTHEAVCGVARSFACHPIAQSIIDGAKKEVSIFKIHQPTGMMLKGRLDILTEDEDGNTVVADIKTTQDASPGGFPREMAKFNYDAQAAFYLDLVGASFFMFLAVEKEAPFAIGVYNLDAESIEIGRQANERNLALLAACIESGIWPAYPQEVTTISLPNWKKKITE